MSASIKQLLVGCALIVGIVAMHACGLTSYLSLTWLQGNVPYLQALVEQRYWYVVTVYLVSYITVSCFAIPGSTFFIITAGLLFGLLPGVFFAMIGLVTGATLLFLISRYVIGSWVQGNYQERFFACNRAIARDGYYYMLLVRMLAVFPFGMLNILAGITLLPVKTFIWTTAVGMLPYVVLYIFAGQQLGNLQPTDTLFSSPMLVFATTLFLRMSLIPLLVRYIFKRRREGFFDAI